MKNNTRKMLAFALILIPLAAACETDDIAQVADVAVGIVAGRSTEDERSGPPDTSPTFLVEPDGNDGFHVVLTGCSPEAVLTVYLDGAVRARGTFWDSGEPYNSSFTHAVLGPFSTYRVVVDSYSTSGVFDTGEVDDRSNEAGPPTPETITERVEPSGEPTPSTAYDNGGRVDVAPESTELNPNHPMNMPTMDPPSRHAPAGQADMWPNANDAPLNAAP